MDVRQQPDNSYQVFKNKMRVALDCHYLRTGEVKPVLLTGLQSSLCVFRELSRGPLCLPHAGNSVCGWYSEGWRKGISALGWTHTGHDDVVHCSDYIFTVFLHTRIFSPLELNDFCGEKDLLCNTDKTLRFCCPPYTTLVVEEFYNMASFLLDSQWSRGVWRTSPNLEFWQLFCGSTGIKP